MSELFGYVPVSPGKQIAIVLFLALLGIMTYTIIHILLKYGYITLEDGDKSN